MNILQISITDVNGGAEKVALDLHRTYTAQGHDAHLVVGHKRSASTDVIGVWTNERTAETFLYKVVRRLEYESGVQALGYWRLGRWLRTQETRWDVVHLHNLHSSYADLGVISYFAANKIPVVQTLHDCWSFTGHCGHFFGCTRWQTGCGKCPNLLVYPSIRFDATRLNWLRKRRVYCDARPCLVTPSYWLKSQVKHSFLHELRCEHISNGVDTTRFVPASQSNARAQLHLPQDRTILLYVANQGLNSTTFKDPDLAVNSLRELIYEHNYTNVLLVVVGGVATVPEDLAQFIVQYEFTTSALEVFYQAADILLYLSKADNCPLVMLEALSCGLPVICTDVGGCAELIESGTTGYVVHPNDNAAVVSKILSLVQRNREQLSVNTRSKAVELYSLSNMASSYLSLYRDLTS